MEDWPDELTPTTQSFYVRRPQSRFRSPFSAATQTQARVQTAHWVGQMTFTRMTQARTQVFEALLAKVMENGLALRVPIFRAPRPIGTAQVANSGSLSVNFLEGFGFREGFGFLRQPLSFAGAALAGAREVTLFGFLPSAVVLQPGDKFELQKGRAYLYAGTSPLLANSQGELRVPVSPALREPVSFGDPVSFERVGVKVRLIPTAALGEALTRKPLVSDFALDFEEDPT
jgi:hypothetical protein